MLRAAHTFHGIYINIPKNKKTRAHLCCHFAFTVSFAPLANGYKMVASNRSMSLSPLGDSLRSCNTLQRTRWETVVPVFADNTSDRRHYVVCRSIKSLGVFKINNRI